MTYNGTEYYYVRNAQGDIIKLIDSTGATVVEYTYDSWGKLLSTTGSLATTLGADQPFRYRGYVYDTETSLYYLQTRYYDPTTCRFISSDVVLSTGQGVLGHNAYAYCGNCPVGKEDLSGEWWQLIAAGVGAVVGVVTQLASDIVVSCCTTGHVELSDWQTYVGAAVGGAVEGFTLAATGSNVLAGSVGSMAGTATTELLYHLTNPTYDKTIGESIGKVLLSGVEGAASAAVGEIISLPKIKGLNKGRNSFSSVYKSGITKLKNGTAKRMSGKVFFKGLVSHLYEDVPLGFAVSSFTGYIESIIVTGV